MTKYQLYGIIEDMVSEIQKEKEHLEEIESRRDLEMFAQAASITLKATILIVEKTKKEFEKALDEAGLSMI